MSYRHILGALLLALAFVTGAAAQESEVSGGGGGTAGAITAGVGSGNAGRVPQFASTTSLVDSKMTTSGTNSGTWTLYDSTGGGLGVTQLILRAGDGQSTTPVFAPFADGAGQIGGTNRFVGVFYSMAVGSNIPTAAGEFLQEGGTSSTRIANGIRMGVSAPIHWSTGHPGVAGTDVGVQRVDVGIIGVYGGDAGAIGGIGASDAATNTVTDALILRHATSGTAAASFGTGLLFQGENAAGTMHDMASIDAVYTDATNGSEDTEVWLNTFTAGVEGVAMVFSQDRIRANSLTLDAVEGAANLSFATGGTTRWYVRGNGIGNLYPNADKTYDFGHPSLQIKDSYLSTSIQGTRTKTLTDTVATDFVTIAIPTDTSVGGTIEYTITYTSGGNQEIESGVLAFAGQNEAGTEAASVSAVGTALQLPAGTMTNVFAVTTGTDNMTISCDADSTALAADPVISYRVYVNSGTATVTPIP